MALASVRATLDRPLKVDLPTAQRKGQEGVSINIRQVLFGKRAGRDAPKHYDPNDLPRDFPPDWDNMAFHFLEFEPNPDPKARYQGFQSINLGRALEFLIGDKFR